jgi:hypothetical protein
MPIKYTYKQVYDTFTQNKCVLISEKYKNQLGKLDYIASCGHNNCVILKNTEWSTDYMFDYNNVDKERLMKIIE